MSNSRIALDPKRVAAVLRLRGETFGVLARAAGVSEVHLHFVLAGKRKLSPRLRGAIAQHLGAAFSFVSGASDTLTMAEAQEVADASHRA